MQSYAQVAASSPSSTATNYSGLFSAAVTTRAMTAAEQSHATSWAAFNDDNIPDNDGARWLRKTKNWHPVTIRGMLKKEPYPPTTNQELIAAWQWRVNHWTHHFTSCGDELCPAHGNEVRENLFLVRRPLCSFCGYAGHTRQDCELLYQSLQTPPAPATPSPSPPRAPYPPATPSHSIPTAVLLQQRQWSPP